MWPSMAFSSCGWYQARDKLGFLRKNLSHAVSEGECHVLRKRRANSVALAWLWFSVLRDIARLISSLRTTRLWCRASFAMYL